ncbi:MAG: hypothetical protein ACKO25_07070, partial [Cyanobium sp.]
QARLVHAEPGRRVVRVSAHQGDRRLGSALGEAADAEQAEERATARLLARLVAAPAAATVPAVAPPTRQASTPTPSQPSPPQTSPLQPAKPERPEPEQPEAEPEPAEVELMALEPPPDPDDWSDELARIDLQCQRLGWNREQEGMYLERAFGHASRSRLTSWADLQAFLRALEGFAPGLDPASAPVPLRRADLLSQCDALLAQLGWGTGQARSFLEQQLGLSTRSQLSDAQLLQFNLLLESELLGRGGAAAPA